MSYKSGQLIEKCYSMVRNVVIAFESQNYRPAYNVGEAVIDWTDTTTYLGVIM